MSPISLVSTVIIARHLVLMAKAMVAVSLASSLLLLLVVGGAVGLGDGGQAWGEGWEDMRQEEVEVGNKKQVEEVEGKVNNRQGRRLGEAEGIAAYNRVDTPFAGFHIFQGKKAKLVRKSGFSEPYLGRSRRGFRPFPSDTLPFCSRPRKA